MKSYKTLVLVGVLLAAYAVPATGETKTYVGQGGKWNVDGDWSPSGSPGPNDIAIINSGKVVLIQDQDEACLQLRILHTNAQLLIFPTRKLTIRGDSRIDGHLLFEGLTLGGAECDREAYLHFAPAEDNALQVIGNGQIRGEDCEGTFYSRGVITGEEIEGVPITVTFTRDEGDLSLEGHLDIQAKIVNQAVVDSSGETLTLTEEDKSGTADGLWKSSSEGQLFVQTPVSGSADWELTHSSADTIYFSAECPNLTGDFVISKGWLVFTADATNTGTLSFTGGATDSKISVSPGTVVEFEGQ